MEVAKVRAILTKLTGTSKRKREDLSNPLVAWVSALLMPLPGDMWIQELDKYFPKISDKPVLYDVTGNPPLTTLEIGDGFQFF